MLLMTLSTFENEEMGDQSLLGSVDVWGHW